jgi:hypothetical protein
MTDAENPRERIGGNEPPPFERLKLREEELVASAARWATDHPFDVNLRDMDRVQKQIDELSNFKIQLTAFWKEVDAQRKVEKKPHDDAAQAVQDKYNPVLDAIKKRGEAVVARLGQWMTHLTGLRDVERQKAEKIAREQREAAEKAEREAAELARQAEAGELKGKNVDVFEAQEKAEQLKAAAKAGEKDVKALSSTVKGGTGTVDGKKKSVAMRPHYTARITSKKAALRFFENDPRILNALQACADEACRKDPLDPPPGVETITEMKPA